MVPMTDAVVEAMTEYIDGSNDVFDRLWKDCEEGKDEEIIIKDVLRACPGGVSPRSTIPHTKWMGY